MTVKTTELNRLTAHEVVRGIKAGDFTAEAVTRACLDRIAARDGAVKAWAFVDPELALRQARALDAGPIRGSLHGVPIGVKDVIDTADMPTQMGSPIYQGHQPKADASCVALVRAAGAVILGKTVTCEFAGAEPSATRNPLNLDHTPGGSSSGSAAAVADGMAAVAFGTQTGGSVLRPASFCGLVGYKPSYGVVNRAGLKFAAESLDTIGTLARTIEDADLVASVLSGRPQLPPVVNGQAPRIGVCRTHLWDTAEPATVAAIDDAAKQLAAAGAEVFDVDLPVGFEVLSEAREVFNDFERARAMAWEWQHHRDRMSDRLVRYIENGHAISWRRYANMKRLANGCRERLDELFTGLEILLTPCVPGEAPKGLATTGDARMQGLWTILHVPTISLPTHTGPNGLPVGIQLVGPPGEGGPLLSYARWVWQRIGKA